MGPNGGHSAAVWTALCHPEDISTGVLFLRRHPHPIPPTNLYQLPGTFGCRTDAVCPVNSAPQLNYIRFVPGQTYPSSRHPNPSLHLSIVTATNCYYSLRCPSPHPIRPPWHSCRFRWFPKVTMRCRIRLGSRLSTAWRNSMAPLAPRNRTGEVITHTALPSTANSFSRTFTDVL